MTEAQKRRFANALVRLSGDEEIFLTLASIAAEDAPGMLNSMSEELKRGDLAAYAKSAHALKGLLSTFETDEPVSEIQPAIDAARQEDQNATTSLHAELQSPLQDLISEIRAVAQVSA